ncbi:hypothetical protein [Bradyrhizobium ottawaense]|uniref:hypothetical protein n=1 Tax=Bradyrhizobium ottawaense TaxID=931866 RepID=UPI001BA6AB21|nr:hypothetical protein [Bradyrhizobium ottawaense]MBR1290142.1 hypothetical protein [Bradyrhizobium ottawaense]
MPIDSYHGELPLGSDVRWISIQVVVERMIERLRSGDDAAAALEEYLTSGRLRCKAHHRLTGTRRLLPTSIWETVTPQWYGPKYGVQTIYRRPTEGTWQQLIENLYIWQPDFDALWSPGAGTPPIAPQSNPAPTPIMSAQAWFKQALKNHPRQPGEELGDYAKRLYPLMLAAPEVKKPWAFKSLRRRLDD